MYKSFITDIEQLMGTKCSSIMIYNTGTFGPPFTHQESK